MTQSLKLDIFKFLKLILFFLIFAFLTRLAFYLILAPQNLFSLEPKDVLEAFFLGLRFDLSGITYVMSFFILFSLFNLNKSATWALKLGFSVWLAVSLIDIGYYQFYNDRINILIFGFIEDDTWALVKTMWKNYPAFWLLLGFTLINLWAYRKLDQILYGKQSIRKNNFKIDSHFSKLSYLFFIPFLIIGGRGTFNLFPLNIGDTVISQNSFINTFSFGSVHAFIRAFKLKSTQLSMGKEQWKANINYFSYKNNYDLIVRDFLKTQSSQPNTTDIIGDNQHPDIHNINFYKNILDQKIQHKNLFKTTPHVVLIVMESWAGFVFYDSTNNFNIIGDLKPHLEKNLFYPVMIPATQATIGSLSCLLSGLPQRPISSFLSESIYLNTQFFTSPALYYKQLGYKTRFIYGGNPGWRDVNKFAHTQGFESVEGEVDIKKYFSQKNEALVGKHDWGIFDEDLFKYVYNTLSEAESPELVVVMTTTNHPPYELPPNFDLYKKLNLDNYKKNQELLDQKLSLQRFSTFLYANTQLAHLLDQIDDNNTLQSHFKFPILLAVTGDHGFRLINYKNTEYIEKNAVPFYIHINQSLLKKNNIQFNLNSFTSHQDIWPTLYELSNSHTENQPDYYTLGNSLVEFKTTPTKNSNINSLGFNGEQHIFYKDKAIIIQNSELFQSYNVQNKTLVKSEQTPDHQWMFEKYKAQMSLLDLLMKASLDANKKTSH